ncbi:hypothetical protein Golomagni_03495 [Golovinomyces magnicellulatus]|nr:hypothetical protein Golomagni_03495 [Golovinomyces magnicellulatus]
MDRRINKADRNLRGARKSHLIDHGIYIAKASKTETVSDHFFNPLTKADYNWSEDEAEAYNKSRPHKFMSIPLNFLLQLLRRKSQ